MEQRLKYTEISPDPFKILLTLEGYLRRCGLDHSLLNLVKLRASQINGCAFCVDMHAREARAAGETDQRLDSLVTWRECPFYTDRERAALEWTEAVTLVSETHVPDDVFQRCRQHFSDKELVDLNYQVISINSFNRLGVTFRLVPGVDPRGK